MAKEHPKQVVIIRDIKSDFIEEAIFVLKNNHDTNKIRNAISIKENTYNNDAVVCEAQSIIDNYIKNHSGLYGSITSMKHRNKGLKKRKRLNLHIGLFLNIVLILSAVILFVAMFKFI